MMRRIVVEEECEHGVVEHGWIVHESWKGCPGGSRTVLEGIPDEWVEAGARALTSGVRLETMTPKWQNHLRQRAKTVLVAALRGTTEEQ